MDTSEGFFPERQILAARRGPPAAEPEPVSSAKPAHGVWVLFICFIPIWMSSLNDLLVAYVRPGHRVTVLFTILYLMAAFALCAVALGIWHGFRSRNRLDLN